MSSLRPKYDQALRELSVRRTGATELESETIAKRALELKANVLTAHINDLESRIEQLTGAQKTQTPFPALSLMDSDREYRASMELEEVPDLKLFVEELQHLIAWAENLWSCSIHSKIFACCLAVWP